MWNRLFWHNLGMNYSMVQSVFDEHQCMLINFHGYSIVQWVSFILYKSKSYLIMICASMSDIRIMEWTVWCNLFLLITNVLIIQSVLGDLVWKIIKIKENSMFHGISLIFHTLNSILWTICDNMDAIIKVCFHLI